MIDLFTLCWLWLAVGIVLGVIKKSCKVLYVLVVLFACLYLIVVVTLGGSFLSDVAHWWYYLIAYPFLILGDLTGQYLAEEFLND